MPKSLNKSILIGNLGADPEVRSISNGTKVAEFSVATSKQWRGRDGQQQEKTEWHRVVAWGYSPEKAGLAGIAERFLKKGDRVYVEGSIEYRQYDDKDGNTRYVTEIRASELIMLGAKDGAGKRPAAQPATRQEASAPKEEYDDDLPF